jgi:ABC-type nickel/cobalt efflux system permease component RcnA
MLLRIIIIAFIGMLIFLGIRRIWRDWSGHFKKVAHEERAEVRARNEQERRQPDVIELKRDRDGTYRPDDDNPRNR